MPGLFPCVTGVPIQKKQSWQAGQECIYFCKTLVGDRTPNPRKGPPATALFIAPTDGYASLDAFKYEKHTFFPAGKVLRLSAPARVRSRSTCGAFGKAAKAALVGGLGCLLNKKILQVFAETKKWKTVSCVPRNTACHY